MSDEKLDLILQKLGSIDTRLDSIESKQDLIENRLDSIDNRLDSVDNRLVSVENRLDSVENGQKRHEDMLTQLIQIVGATNVKATELFNGQKRIESDVSEIKQDIKSIKLDVITHEHHFNVVDKQLTQHAIELDILKNR